MIISYLNLVGSASAKELFYHCVGTLIKQEEMRYQAEVSELIYLNSGRPLGECIPVPAPINPVEFRTAITNDIIGELEKLMEEKLISKSTNAVGQVFYRTRK